MDRPPEMLICPWGTWMFGHPQVKGDRNGNICKLLNATPSISYLVAHLIRER